jgi:hypothetical protein
VQQALVIEAAVLGEEGGDEGTEGHVGDGEGRCPPSSSKIVICTP